MPADAVPPPGEDTASADEAGVPAAPVVKPEELWFDTPCLLVNDIRYPIGWQRWSEKNGGPGYVMARRTALGTLKIVERYPLTDAGWAGAWRALMKLDPAAAEKIRSALDRRAEADRHWLEAKELDARSLAHLPSVIFVGGYLPVGQLTAGQMYALRFLEDHIAVYQQNSARPLATFNYSEVQAVEVAGPGLVRKWSPGQQAMITAAFGVTGALVAYANTKMKTFVRMQTADSELFFLHTTLLPEDLRIHLSRGIGAVREAQAAAASAVDPAQPGARSLVDELTRLAGLLETGLLTRDEFDQLKAKLIASE